MARMRYTVTGMSCEHCRSAVEAEVGAVPGVEAVAVDLDRGLVVVEGRGAVGDADVRAAIAEAGYDVEGDAVEVAAG